MSRCFTVMRLKTAGIRRLLVPAENAEEAAVVEGIDVHPIAPYRLDLRDLFAGHGHDGVDLADVKGQEHAKRALGICHSSTARTGDLVWLRASHPPPPPRASALAPSGHPAYGGNGLRSKAAAGARRKE